MIWKELMEKAKSVYATWKENEAKQQKLAESKTTIQKIIDQQKKLENEIKVNKVRINSAKTSIHQFRQMIEKVEEKYDYAGM